MRPVCRIFSVDQISLENALILHELCRHPDVSARAAIVKRWESRGILDNGVAYATVEIAISDEQMLRLLEHLYHKTTGQVLDTVEMKWEKKP